MLDIRFQRDAASGKNTHNSGAVVGVIASFNHSDEERCSGSLPLSASEH